MKEKASALLVNLYQQAADQGYDLTGVSLLTKNTIQAGGQSPSGTKSFQASNGWFFPADFRDQVFAYTCDFTHPFWAHFTIEDDGHKRVTHAGAITITETLFDTTNDGYIYHGTGFPDVSNYQGRFSVTDAGDGRIKFSIAVRFDYESLEGFFQVAEIVSGFFAAVTKKLEEEFGRNHPA